MPGRRIVSGWKATCGAPSSTISSRLHYQPIVSLSLRALCRFESLVRWTRDGESVSPATFIPIAEELGLVDRIGTWVLAEACQTFAEWRRRYAEAAWNASLSTSRAVS
jgi:EAL domain-containing protein (putative c-di-GMP-specific phosphodiesterase class I)